MSSNALHMYYQMLHDRFKTIQDVHSVNLIGLAALINYNLVIGVTLK